MAGLPDPPRLGLNQNPDQNQAVVPRPPANINEQNNEHELHRNVPRINDQQPAIPRQDLLANGLNHEAPALRVLAPNDNNDINQLPDVNITRLTPK